MNRKPLIASLLVSLIIVGALAASLLAGTTPQLGLDLEGGVSVIYSPVLQEGVEEPEDFDEVLDETVEVIRNRVDALGVAEPEITRQGGEILVQLPGIDNEDRVQEIIGRTAQLTFRRVEEVIPADSDAYAEAECPEDGSQVPDDEGIVLCQRGDQALDPENPTKYRVGPAELAGSSIEQAFATVGQGGYVVSLELDGEGAEDFAHITAELACERDGLSPDGDPPREGEEIGTGLFAIVLDGEVYSAPGVNSSIACLPEDNPNRGITGGQASISVGGGDQTDGGEQEAIDLSLVLRSGALPITLVSQDFRTVSPTLGAESLDAGLMAAGIGLLLVALYLIFFYRWLGVVAIGALTVFGVVVTGVLGLAGGFGFTLTLAGIAGIVVSIGITADSSILFFERIRDEVRLGKTVRTAVQKAFDSAFRTNLAGNTVTLVAALVLYFLAVGPVRGFALTLGIATILDIAILYGFTRPVVFLLGTSTRLIRRDNLRVEQPGSRTAQEVA